MRKFIFLACFFSCFFTFSVEDTLYFNRDWHYTTKEKATYYRILLEQSQGGYWEYFDYYIKNDSLQNKGFFSQLNPNIHDSTNYWYHDNGQLSQKGFYEKGLAKGEWTKYHRNGLLQSKGHYDTHRLGEWEWWFPSGNKKSEAKYDSLGLVGKKIWYFDLKGSLRKVEFYKEDVLDSIQTEYYKSGQIKKSK